MSDEKKLAFNSFEFTSYKRKNTAILRSVFDEIERYLNSGCTREDIYHALTSAPYNVKMTKGSFINALHRIRNEIKKKGQNKSGSNGIVKTSTLGNKTQTLPQSSDALKGLGRTWDENPTNIMGEPLDD